HVHPSLLPRPVCPESVDQVPGGTRIGRVGRQAEEGPRTPCGTLGRLLSFPISSYAFLTSLAAGSGFTSFRPVHPAQRQAQQSEQEEDTSGQREGAKVIPGERELR